MLTMIRGERAGKQDSDFQKLVNHFILIRGIPASNPALLSHAFGKHGAAARMLLEMADNDIEIAKLAVTEISKFLDRMVRDQGWNEWRNMNAIVNQFPEWKKEYDQEKNADQR